MTDLGEGPGPPGLRFIFGSDYGGRKGIGNLNIGQKRKQQLCKCIMLFCAFLCRPVHNRLISRFMENVDELRRKFLSLLKREYGS